MPNIQDVNIEQLRKDKGDELALRILRHNFKDLVTDKGSDKDILDSLQKDNTTPTVDTTTTTVDTTTPTVDTTTPTVDTTTPIVAPIVDSPADTTTTTTPKAPKPNLPSIFKLKGVKLKDMVQQLGAKDAFRVLKDKVPDAVDWDKLGEIYTSTDGTGIEYTDLMDKVISTVDTLKSKEDYTRDISNSEKVKKYDHSDFTKVFDMEFQGIKLLGADILHGVNIIGDKTHKEIERDVHSMTKAIDDSIKDKSFLSMYTLGKVAEYLPALTPAGASTLLRGAIMSGLSAGVSTAPIALADNRAKSPLQEALVSTAEDVSINTVGGVAGSLIGALGGKVLDTITNSSASRLYKDLEDTYITTDKAKKDFNIYFDDWKKNFDVKSKKDGVSLSEEKQKAYALVDHLYVTQGKDFISKAASDSNAVDKALTEGIQTIKDKVVDFSSKIPPKAVVDKTVKQIDDFKREVSGRFDALKSETSDIPITDSVNKDKPLETILKRKQSEDDLTPNMVNGDGKIDIVPQEVLDSMTALQKVGIKGIKDKIENATSVSDYIEAYKATNALGFNNDEARKFNILNVKEGIKELVDSKLASVGKEDLMKEWETINTHWNNIGIVQNSSLGTIINSITTRVSRNGKVQLPTKEFNQGLKELQSITNDGGEKMFTALRQVVDPKVADNMELTVFTNALKGDNFSIDTLGKAIVGKDLQGKVGKEMTQLVDTIGSKIPSGKNFRVLSENIEQLTKGKTGLAPILQNRASVAIAGLVLKTINILGVPLGKGIVREDRLIKLLQNPRVLKDTTKAILDSEVK